ncbi:MAG: sulfatase-like hydrolase/transferase [Chloroflexi bacterium]|nr:sulfatase-like hydrolase/transferase [Chloroflexota bacterium]
MPKQPNILIVMSDEHSPRFSGAYGHPFIDTPNMQRLADEGVTFENAYCNSPVCAPSRASFMAGQLLPSVGVWDNAASLSSDEATWAHLLNAAGYETVLCGKMHFQGPDQSHGFKRRILSDCHGDWDLRLTANWSEWRPENAAFGKNLFTVAGPGEDDFSAYDEAAAARASGYIRGRADSDHPWAMLVGFITPHFPFVVRRPYWNKYYPEHADQPEIPAHFESMHPHNRRMAEWFSYIGVDPDLTARSRAAYYGLIDYCDFRLGQVLDALEESGQLDETLVVYTSDHGDSAGEHGMWTKQTFFEDSVRVPLHIRWPGRARSGLRIKQPVSLVDLTRTILDAAGADSPDFWAGESLLPLADGAPETAGEVIADYTAVAAKGPCRMVRVGELKYNYYHGHGNDSEELFDLASDPRELVDQVRNPEFAAALAELRARAMRDYDPDRICARVLRSQQKRRLIDAGQGHTPAGYWKPGNP